MRDLSKIPNLSSSKEKLEVETNLNQTPSVSNDYLRAENNSNMKISSEVR